MIPGPFLVCKWGYVGLCSCPTGATCPYGHHYFNIPEHPFTSTEGSDLVALSNEIGQLTEELTKPTITKGNGVGHHMSPRRRTKCRKHKRLNCNAPGC